MDIRKLLFPTILCMLSFLDSHAQYSKVFTDKIQTFRIENNKGLTEVPIIQLKSNDYLNISFDDLQHEYQRYIYRIEHCSYDWKTSDELFESDYLASAGNAEVIDDYQQSLNTSVLYTHYQFTIPNANCRPLLSGNYRLTIYTEDEDNELRPVVESYFYVVDSQVNIQAEATTNTDIDWNKEHQQLSISINMNDLQFRDLRSELKIHVLQNQRWDMLVTNPTPTYIMGSNVIWDHCRELIFKAGNEYRKFEMLSTRYPGMHMESMKWFRPYYHATLFPDAPRRNYLYDEDQNGLSVVRSETSGNAGTESDYVFTHYCLETDYIPDYKIYVNGTWTHGGFTPQYEMKYNFEAGAYEADILQKLGYYNYLYLAVNPSNGKRGETAPIEGDFFQTENEYTIFAYYRKTGERYDKLVGIKRLSFRPQ